MVGHGEGQVVDLRQHRAEAGLVGLHLAGQADAGQRAAVEAAGEGDHRRATRVEAGDLQRVLDRLRTRREEDGFLGACAGGERVECLGECDVTLVGRHLEAGVSQLLQLPRDRGTHPGMHVTGVEHGDAAGEVDVAAALDIPQLGVGGALGVHGERVGDTARDGLLTTGVQFGVRGHGGRPFCRGAQALSVNCRS